MSKIEGYVVNVGVYVEKSFYITDSDEESAVDAAYDEFKGLLEGLDYSDEDIEVLGVDPEYYDGE